MTPRSFVLYNVVGAVGWVGLCVGAGVLFGNVPIVKENFSLVDDRHRRRLDSADGDRVPPSSQRVE